MKLDQPSYHCITWRCQFGTEHVRLQPVMVEKATRKSQANQNRVQVQTSRLRFRITDMQNWHPNILVMSIITLRPQSSQPRRADYHASCCGRNSANSSS